MVIQDSLSTNVSMLVRALVFILAALCIMFYLSWQLTLVQLISMIPIVIVMTGYSRKMRTFQANIQKEKSKMTIVAEEAFSNVRTVKAFSNEDAEVEKFALGNIGVYAVGMQKAYFQAAFTFSQQIFLYGGMAVVVKLGVYLYLNGLITVGAITSFLFYMLMLLWNSVLISWTLGNVFAVVGASDKIVEIMQHKPKFSCEGGLKPEGEVRGNLSIRGLRFAYPSKLDVEVLKGVDIEVDNTKNRVVALCGTSGCGKSTIIQMIERYYDPTGGQVLFNGVDIKELDPRWYHE